VRLATRLFASIALLVTVAVVGSIVAADLLLRRLEARSVGLRSRGTTIRLQFPN
jgi:hypothetical protein